jgi:hypothetical protein
MLDPVISLAFSVYSGSGNYALLLGSGISRSAGIPTGWDIVLDLIQKVAALKDEDCAPDPAAWYQTAFGKEPDYSDVLAMLAVAPAERRQLLNAYFEPTREERDQGRKAPTAAHKAIASLVASGFVKVIVTTNFDRLLERALEEAGVAPSVIASSDAIRGAVPLAHAPCTIIKIHGDYLDTRIKNTPTEIGEYDETTNRLLDQIFDEYGLIVSGWSADWDVALRAAIERCPNRRYTMFWSAYRDVSGAAKSLCDHRSAQVIKGMDADAFFTMLADKVGTLKELDAPHPLSSRIAVAALKQYIVEDRKRIRLHDLIIGEAETVAAKTFTEESLVEGMRPLAHYEKYLETLLALLVAGGSWGRRAQRPLWLKCFHRLVTPRSWPFDRVIRDMDLYPSYLLLYGFGIAAIAAGRSGNLAYIFASAKARSMHGREGSLLLQFLHALRGGELDSAIQRSVPSYQRRKSPTSPYLFERLREPLREWIPEDGRYEECFCRFEYLIALVIADLYQKTSGHFQAIDGLYIQKSQYRLALDAEITKVAERWSFLKAGLFEGSIDRLRLAKQSFDAAVENRAQNLPFNT